jgi:hypothetical protein
MPIYTYVRNADPGNPTRAILLREGALKLYIGTYANITSIEVAEIRDNGQYVLEEGIVPPASSAGTGTPYSTATIVPNWEPHIAYIKGQAVLYEGSFYTSKLNFESSETFEVKNWNEMGSSGATTLTGDATGKTSENEVKTVLKGKTPAVLESGKLPEAYMPVSVASGSTEGTAVEGLLPYSTGSGNKLAWTPGPVNVQSIGVKPGGNGSTALLAKINALLGEGIRAMTFYFPASASAYQLALGTLGEAVIGKGVSLTFYGDNKLTSRIAPASATEPIVTIEGPADNTNCGLSLRHIGLELTADRAYNKPLIQQNFSKGYTWEHVALIDKNYVGLFFSGESSYEMYWDDVEMQEGKFALPFVHTNVAIPVNATELQVCDTFSFRRCGLTVNGPIFRNAGEQIHNITCGPGYKAQQSVYYPASPTLQTGELAEAVEVGATKLKLKSGTATVGSMLRVGNDALGHSSDYLKVTAASGTGITVSATTPFLFAHAIGTAVQEGGIGLTLGDGVQSATLNNPHLEHYASGVALGSTGGVVINDLYSTSTNAVQRCGGDTRTTINSGTLIGTAAGNNLGSIAVDNPATTLGEWVTAGAFWEPSGSPSPMALIPSSATNYTAQYKGNFGGWNTRKNTFGTTAYRDSAYEVTNNAAVRIRMQYGGRGYFADGVAVVNLGNITGLTSKEIREKCAIAASDSTSLGEILYVAELSGSQVMVQIPSGAAQTVYVSGPLTKVGATAKQRGTLEARGVLLPAVSGGIAIPTSTGTISEANRAFLHRAFTQRGGTLKQIYVWSGATKNGKTRLAVFDAGEAENEHITVLWEGAEVEITEENKWILMGEPELPVVENQQLVLGIINSGTTQLFGRSVAIPATAGALTLPSVFLPDSPGVTPKLVGYHKYASTSFGGVGAHLADANIEPSGTAYAILGHIE